MIANHALKIMKNPHLVRLLNVLEKPTDESFSVCSKIPTRRKMCKTYARIYEVRP